MSVILPIKVDAPHHAGIVWDPPGGDEPMSEVEEAQYSRGLGEAIKSITREHGYVTSVADPLAEPR